jgi:hypothetical protein
MQFSGKQLDTILKQQSVEVAVYDGQGFLKGKVRPLAAMRLTERCEYVGIGNKRRIRYIRPLWGAGSLGDLNNASCTTCRIRNDLGVIIASRPHLEHKTVASR